MSLLTAGLVARSSMVSGTDLHALAKARREAYQRRSRRCRSLTGPHVATESRPPGEVPERLNGRDWKSRNGGNFVRGFESLPLRSPDTLQTQGFWYAVVKEAASAPRDRRLGSNPRAARQALPASSVNLPPMT